MNKELEELDKLASKFIIGHKKLSANQREILTRIDKLKKEEVFLEQRILRIKNLILIMYSKLEGGEK